MKCLKYDSAPRNFGPLIPSQSPTPKNKSRAIAGKPCEAVKISIFKSSGKFHTDDIATDRKNLHFIRPHSHLTPTHQRTPSPDEYRHSLNTYRQKPQTVGYIFGAIIGIFVFFKTIKPSNRSILAKRSHPENSIFNAKWLFMDIQGHLFRCR